MKTAATPLRPLFLTLGALLVFAAVAWGLHARSQSVPAVVAEPQSATTVAVAVDVGLAPAAPTMKTPEPAAVAAPEPAVPTTAPAPAGDGPPVESGVKAYFDPETGTLTSDPQGIESQAIVGATGDNPEQLPEIELGPGMGVMVDLQGHFQESLVMTVDAQGRRVLRCTLHPGEVIVMGNAPVHAPEVK